MSTTLIRAERPLFEGADWEFGTIQRCYDGALRIAGKYRHRSPKMALVDILEGCHKV